MKDQILLPLMLRILLPTVPQEMRIELEEQLAMTVERMPFPNKKKTMRWVNQFRIFQFVKYGSWLNLKPNMVDPHFALKALTLLRHRRLWPKPPKPTLWAGMVVPSSSLVQGTCRLWKSWASETTRPVVKPLDWWPVGPILGPWEEALRAGAQTPQTWCCKSKVSSSGACDVIWRDDEVSARDWVPPKHPKCDGGMTQTCHLLFGSDAFVVAPSPCDGTPSRCHNLCGGQWGICLAASCTCWCPARKMAWELGWSEELMLDPFRMNLRIWPFWGIKRGPTRNRNKSNRQTWGGTWWHPS